jgi:sugar lactone lactonase YvrE
MSRQPSTASERSGARALQAVALGVAALAAFGTSPVAAQPPANVSPLAALSSRTDSTMRNPYRIVENWPTLPQGATWGAAIGLIPDNTGGTWMMFRSEPPINLIATDGTITKSFGAGLIVQAHGFCRDHDGNFWAGDSGPFRDDPATRGRGFQLHKFSPNGKLLMSLGKPGVSRAGTDTFIGPTACAVAANGDIVIADGHWPRPSTAQQDGDRLVRIKPDGTFIRAVGRLGNGPGEFAGPHGLAFDSRGRLFVADRSNNRIQILDENLSFVDEWRHFSRPSGIAILADDTLIVSDSESGRAIEGPSVAPEGGGSMPRNPGWQNGIRIGSARDGSISEFIPGTLPEGLAADERGNIFAGLTSGCATSPSGGCLQKWVRTPSLTAATDVLRTEIEAVMRAPEGGADRQVKVVDVGDLNVAVGVLQRQRVGATRGPVRGLIHTNVTEVYYILSGGGTLVTGGQLVDATPFASDSEVVEVAVGPTLAGGFAGGERRKVAAGDVVVIPAGVPHGWAEVPDHVDYLSIRPDADHVLPSGYVNPAARR